MNLEIKKDLASNWFKILQDAICNDISNFEKILKQIAIEHSDLDVIVNNAGITDDAILLRMKTEQWEKVIQANLSSNFIIVKNMEIFCLCSLVYCSNFFELL